MIGRIYAKILLSDFGTKYLDFEKEGETLKWTEKGLNRFMFWNILGYFLIIFGTLGAVFTFSPRLIFSAIILSLYTKEKASGIFVSLLSDMDRVDFEKSTPIEETWKYKIIRDIFNGDSARESFKRHS